MCIIKQNDRDPTSISLQKLCFEREVSWDAVLSSTHRISQFVLHQPRTIGEALEVLQRYGSDTVLMSGGVDVTNRLKSGLGVGHVVYLPGIEELHGIEATSMGISIGACVTHREFETSPLVRTRLPGLREIWSRIGSVRIRHAGTIAGNILARERSYDVTPVLASLGAQLTFVGTDKTAAFPVEALWENGAEKPENATILTGIDIPVRPGTLTTYCRDFKPVVTIAVTVTLTENNIIEGRIAVGCAFDSLKTKAVQLLPPFEDRLRDEVEEATERFVDSLAEPLENHEASSPYRKRLVRVLVRRELEQGAGYLLRKEE